VSGTADAVPLSSSTPQPPLCSINNLLRKSVEEISSVEADENGTQDQPLSAQQDPGETEVHTETGNDFETDPDMSELTQSRSSETDLEEESDEMSNEEESGQSSDFGLYSKWFFIGIGGCGSNLVDTALLRKRQLRRNDSDLQLVWQNAFHDAVALDTNQGHLEDTYFIREYTSADSHGYTIGGGTGSGTDPFKAISKIDSEIEENPVFDGYYSKLKDLDVPRALMIMHSAVKGTGTGAAPRFTEAARNHAKGENAEIYHYIVLSDQGDQTAIDADTDRRFNNLLGVLNATNNADAIILTNNANLENVSVSETIEDYPDWKEGYRPENETALAFLEGFTVSSVTAGSQVEDIGKGDKFDVGDGHIPPKKFMSDDAPAVILAPALGEISSLESKEELKMFLHNTFRDGRLIDFDPGSAWGGAFLFYGDRELVSNARDYDNTFGSILADMPIDFYFTDEFHVGPVHRYYHAVSGMDTLRVWIVMWNPHIPILEDTWKLVKANQALSDNSEIVNELIERGDEIDSLFDTLGGDTIAPDDI